jgi:hypothetical protein
MLMLPSAFTIASVGTTTVDAVSSTAPSSSEIIVVSVAMAVSLVVLDDEPQAVSVMAKRDEMTMCLRIKTI